MAIKHPHPVMVSIELEEYELMKKNLDVLKETFKNNSTTIFQNQYFGFMSGRPYSEYTIINSNDIIKKLNELNKELYNENIKLQEELSELKMPKQKKFWQ